MTNLILGYTLLIILSFLYPTLFYWAEYETFWLSDLMRKLVQNLYNRPSWNHNA